MTAMRRLVLATALATLLAPAGWAQERAPKQVPLPNSILLARSWDEAKKEAQIRNVPILFTTMMAT